METKGLTTIAIAVIALLVGAGIGWLASTSFYADDLATAASVKEAIGEDAYLARGAANTAVSCMSIRRDLTTRQMRVIRTPCPTATPLPAAPCSSTPATYAAPFTGRLCVGDSVAISSSYSIRLTAASSSDIQFQIIADGRVMETKRLTTGSTSNFTVGGAEVSVTLNGIDTWSGGVLTARITVSRTLLPMPRCTGTETNTLMRVGDILAHPGPTGNYTVQLLSVEPFSTPTGVILEADFRVSDGRGHSTTIDVIEGAAVTVTEPHVTVKVNRLFSGTGGSTANVTVCWPS